ncbi:MAG: hypothetical protein Q8P91_01450 [bacterium]|nr:hypothetical protein [bacterium]
MNSAKTVAQQVAKQMAQESPEILDNRETQGTGAEQPIDRSRAVDQTQLQQQDKLASVRRMEALDTELKDIRRQRLFNDLQRRIQEGQEVFLNDITELSYEQKDVLKAQMEVVKHHTSNIVHPVSLVEPASKPSRRFAFGKGAKAQALKQQTKTERPLPPSG